MTLLLSGPEWVAKFPTSRNMTDLAEPFQSNVLRFDAALYGAKANVNIAATYRPPERAYLMHYACMIADSGQDPEAVPPMAGVDIQWMHESVAASREAARAMKAAYGIKFPAALVSRHTQRRAIDWTITNWQGKTITLLERDLAHNPKTLLMKTESDLWAAGKAYGVIRLPSDPVHWSDDGR